MCMSAQACMRVYYIELKTIVSDLKRSNRDANQSHFSEQNQSITQDGVTTLVNRMNLTFSLYVFVLIVSL